MRRWLPLLLLTVPLAAPASPGLVLAAAYYCDADSMHVQLAKICSTKFPNLAERTAQAYEKWRSLELAEATEKKNNCEADLKKLYPTAEAVEAGRSQMRSSIRKTQGEMAKTFTESLEQSGEAPCLEMIEKFESGNALK